MVRIRIRTLVQERNGEGSWHWREFQAREFPSVSQWATRKVADGMVEVAKLFGYESVQTRYEDPRVQGGMA